MTAHTNDRFLDMTVLEAAMRLAGEEGWHRFSLVEAARQANIPAETVRRRYPCKMALLTRLNRLADDAVLCSEGDGTTLHERLFDAFMRRLDVFQDYREGVCAVLHALPRDPALAAMLSATTMDSLCWIADHAGLDRYGIGGFVRLNGLFAIWTYTLRAWESDESPSLAITMSTLNAALERAERFGVLKPSTRVHAPPVTPEPQQTAPHHHEEQHDLPDHVPHDDED